MIWEWIKGLPKVTSEQAFAYLCVAMAVLTILIVLFLIPSCVDRYVTVIEGSVHSLPVRKDKR